MGPKCTMFLVNCLLVAFLAVLVNSVPVGNEGNTHLLGSKKCTQGPSYWCANITNAKNCNAVKHCIQTVWEKQALPEDNDDVCQICKDMVAQARAQLESNETQDELRQVFEGSCKLIPLKIVREECIKLSDEFVPELVETLASQMNPQVVCAVAGLCNSARIDKLLEEAKVNKDDDDDDDVVSPDEASSPDECEDCNKIAREMEKKFQSTPKDDVLNNMLEACGKLGSFSDGCSAIIITHFDSLYDHLQKNFDGDGLCHLSGMCQYKFHTHSKKEIEVVHKSSVGVLDPINKDDVPCELCEKLVFRLRDILVANTTETEFEQVLKAFCNQFKSFKTQCLSIVDEYYAVIYDFLVNSLDAQGVCSMAGICPRPTINTSPISPLVPVEVIEKYNARKMQKQPLAGHDEANSYNTLHRVSLGNKGISVHVSQSSSVVPLPIERMMPDTITYAANKEICTFCEYALHYIQVALTTPSTEDEIKDLVFGICDHLPHTVDDECHSFIDTYGNALVALLAQEIDPSVVCPKLGLCPQSQVLIERTQMVEDKPTCPLCLFAVEELKTKLKDNKTEDEIRKALDNLCQDLPKSLIGECRTFVKNYAEALVDMIVADFTPQEVCAYLKLCDAPTTPERESLAHEILTNEIPQLPDEKPEQAAGNSRPDKKTSTKDSTSCVLCEFVLSKLDAALKDKTTDDEIKAAVHDVCNWMPRTILTECNKFVDQYADLIFTLLAQSIDPKEVCTEIKLCIRKQHTKTKPMEQCTVCDATIGALEKLLDDKSEEEDVPKALQKVCDMVSSKYQEKCASFIKIYGPSILNLVARKTPLGLICEKVGLCYRNRQTVQLLGDKQCTWGPAYWCQSEAQAKSCGALAHCQERVWKAEKPTA